MIAIVDYNAGNVRSVSNALQRLGVQSVLTHDQELLQQADRVIFPGVGEAASAMAFLKDYDLVSCIKNLRQPFLGICLGLQLMCSYSEEGDTECLGIFDEKVLRFPAEKKVPHMGWNALNDTQTKLFEGLDNQEDMYFVHSYYAAVGGDTIATTEYILPFSAALQKDNFYAVQFHPEKSSKAGSRLLQNFLEL